MERYFAKSNARQSYLLMVYVLYLIGIILLGHHIVIRDNLGHTNLP